MTNYKEMLDEMFNTQDKLNISIDHNWIDIRTEREWIRAFWLELAELIESLPWKWWKSVNPDINNVKIELVDCVHMLLSFVLIHEHKSGISLKECFLKELTKEKSSNEVDFKALIVDLESCVEHMLSSRYEQGISLFCEALLKIMDLETLYKLYMGKNILNSLRQDYGYRSGAYIKVIEGKEDNEYLYEFIEEGKSLNEIKSLMVSVIEKVNTKVN